MFRLWIVVLLFLVFIIRSESTDGRELYQENSNPINFVGKANEFLDGSYLFYNTEPNIGLSGLVPRRLDTARLSDNLLVRLLPHCECSRCKFFCSCCSEAKLNAIGIHTTACVKVEYLEKEVGFSYSVTVNDNVYLQREVSVKNPPPVCFLIPTPLPRLKTGACITMYDIDVNGDLKTVHGCVRVSFSVFGTYFSKYDLGCFHINIKNGHHLHNRTEMENRNELGLDPNFLSKTLQEYKVNKSIFDINPFDERKEEEVTTIFSNDTDYTDTNASQSILKDPEMKATNSTSEINVETTQDSAQLNETENILDSDNSHTLMANSSLNFSSLTNNDKTVITPTET